MKTQIECIQTPLAPAAIGPYSQAVRAGDFLYVSGQLPINPETGELVEADIRLQTQCVMKNIEAILKSQQLNWDRVVKTECYLQSMGDFVAMNGVYAEFFSGTHKPARQAMEVACLPKKALIEISCVACY